MGGQAVPVVMAGHQVLNLGHAEVDAFSRATHGVATVFVRSGDDFLRVSTSLRKEDGSRAVGTLLGAAHPARRAVMAGEAYLGRARLFGRDYMTKYTPVKEGSNVTAILFVGLDITDDLGALLAQLGKARIGEKGYYVVVDGSGAKSRGELIVHPELRGRNALTDVAAAAYKPLLENPPGAFGDGSRKLVRVRFDPWGWIVGASVDLDELHADASNLRTQMLATGAAVVVAGCLATYLVLSRRLRPLRGLALDAERMGQGDLTVRTRHAGHDEVGELAAAFNRMAEQFGDIIVRMKRASVSIGDAVGQVRGESAQVQQGSQEQSESASRVATALEEVAVGLKHVASNARDSQRLSQRTNDLTQEGETVAQRTSEEIAAIALTVRDAELAIEGLSQRSQEISIVVQVIKDIADQTNLLALNAAIEAARAGEQGRGFAVVADEVRKLAERTSQATIRIGSMITAIQDDTQGAVSGMKSSSGRVEVGVQLAREVARALSQIREAANETLVKAREITVAMDEQNAASAEIARNVEHIATMADGNHAAAERSHASVQRLEALAADLGALTGGLKAAS
jgi:methyl-accepting chemotaxis protein